MDTSIKSMQEARHLKTIKLRDSVIRVWAALSTNNLATLTIKKVKVNQEV